LIGAGGIGFDVAEFLVFEDASPTLDPPRWMAEWGVDPSFESAGGLQAPDVETPAREVWLLQRSPGRPGARLGKTTGWIHRASLKHRQVRMLGGVSYERIDDAGLHITIDGVAQCLEVDDVVICAGQDPLRQLLAPLTEAGRAPTLIGGADVALELDAKRAIAQGSRVAAGL
jgi:2,4-dienoyl-CoA reductase (NADPH2)